MRKVIICFLFLPVISLGQNTYPGTGSPDIKASLLIGNNANNTNNSLIIRGPNAPTSPASYQDINYTFLSAGSARMRAYRGTGWDTYLQFLTNSSTATSDNPAVRMHIDGNGNVGIGTASPAYPLDVNGIGQFAGGTKIGSGPIGYFGDGGNHAVRAFNVANSGFYVQSYSGTNTYMYVGQMGTYAGKVGIGTTTPKTPLEILANSNDLLTLTSSIGGPGNTGNLYMDCYNVGSNPHLSRIQVIDDGIYAAHLAFSTKITGASTNALAERMRITSSGNVGIGTATPTSLLHLYYSTSNTPLINVQGTLANGYSQMQLTGTGRSYYSGVGNASETQFGVANKWYLFDVAANAMRMTLDPSGNVGIGTTNPGTMKLAVAGTIGARKVIVTQANPFPDYVFQPDYNLRSLTDLEAYIKKYSHLPEVPSAKEVEEGGLDLGATQAALLKKIEELTLYVIEIKKENKRLSERIEKLEK